MIVVVSHKTIYSWNYSSKNATFIFVTSDW